MVDSCLEDNLPADVDGVVQVGEQVGEDERRHVAHNDLAKLLPDVHGRADLVGSLLDDVRQGEDVGVEVAVGRLVDHLDDGVDVLDAVLVGDDVEADRHGAVDQDPLQSFDVSENRNFNCWLLCISCKMGLLSPRWQHWSQMFDKELRLMLPKNVFMSSKTSHFSSRISAAINNLFRADRAPHYIKES